MIYFRGGWTLEEDLQILETVFTKGQKWALVSKQLKGRTENSVKNRYLSLLNLHTSTRKKEKLSSNDLKTKINQKILELKVKIFDKSERERVLELRTEKYLNKFPSEDFIKERTNENSEQNINFQAKLDENKHVTFSEDVLMSPTAILGLISTKESFPLSNPMPNFDSDRNLVTKPLTCKNHSENKIILNQYQEEMKNEINSLEEFSSSHLNKEKSLFRQNKSLSKSFSKLSMASSNMRSRSPIQKRLLKEPNNPNPEQNSWSKSGQNFSSISSISKKTDNIPKQHSESSIVSLSEVHILPSSKSDKSRSINDSSLSLKEKNFLLSAINNLKSEGSSIISAESMKIKMMNQMEEEKKI